MPMTPVSREFTWRRSKSHVTYSNTTRESGSIFLRKSKTSAEDVACRQCHLVHAVRQTNCDDY